MRYLIRSVPEREWFLPEIAVQIPQLEVVRDSSRSAMETFLLTLMEAGEDAAVLMEDDIELTSGFQAKVDAAVWQRPDNLIQFFSLRQADREKGSRWMPGSTYLMNQCFYLPTGYAAQIYAYYPVWPRRSDIGRGGTDTLVKHWLAARRERYWLHVPSLVQHRVAKSAIDPRRSSKRQSVTFQP